MSATVAIIGRPNVGKSTLFNRLAGRRLALVDDRPGLTRDRREAIAVLEGFSVCLVDTAGLEEAEPDSLTARMRGQTEQAIADADLIVFMIDARVGVTPADEDFARLARRSGKPVVLAANKIEGRQAGLDLYEAYDLGLGDPVSLSAEHGLGMPDLIGAIAEKLADAEAGREPEPDEEAGEGRPLQVAIVGRPNAGKSTLANALIGEERVITGPEAGITRDAIALDVEWSGRPLRLFDTAGLRRKARVQGRAEELSVSDALRAIRFAEVLIILLDAQKPFDKQDLQIADLAAREGRAVVLAINKWDLVAKPRKVLPELLEQADRLLPQIKGVPLVPISARDGRGLDRLMQAVFEMNKVWNRRLPTAALNRWLAGMIERHTPPAVAGRRIKLRYMTQSNARPPTFVLFCSRPKELPSAYTRYLVNGLRESFDMPGVPIRLHLRQGENPYAKAGRRR